MAAPSPFVGNLPYTPAPLPRLALPPAPAPPAWFVTGVPGLGPQEEPRGGEGAIAGRTAQAAPVPASLRSLPDVLVDALQTWAASAASASVSASPAGPAGGPPPSQASVAAGGGGREPPAGGSMHANGGGHDPGSGAMWAATAPTADGRPSSFLGGASPGDSAGEPLVGTALAPLVLTNTVFHYRSPD